MARNRDAQPAPQEPSVLSWHDVDLEARMGLRASRFTSASGGVSFLAAGLGTAAVYAALLPFHETYFAQTLTERGFTQHAVVLLTLWSCAILFLKWRKLVTQRLALIHPVIPADADFVISASSADDLVKRIHQYVDEPRNFMLFNRILIALGNLRNLGRVSDVDDILRSQAEHDESAVETSYALVRGFVWAIPVLGFIGTVYGLSIAISAFGQVLTESGEIAQLTTALKAVTAGLATAFETTFVALLAALGIQLCVIFLKKAEEEFLDQCSDYCQLHIVNRLRLLPYDPESLDHEKAST